MLNSIHLGEVRKTNSLVMDIMAAIYCRFFLCGFRIQTGITWWEKPGVMGVFFFFIPNWNVVFGSVFVFYNYPKLAVKISTDNVYCEDQPPLPPKNKNKNPTTNKTKVKRCQIRHCDIKLVIHIEKPPDWGSFKMQKYFGDPSVQVCLRYTVFLADQTPSLVAVKHTQRYKHIVCAAAVQRQK